jgi:hypothetical protein
VSEVENQNDLETGEETSAVPVIAEPVSLWDTLTLDPTFIVTQTSVPSREVAFERLLEEARAAMAAPEYFGALTIAEGWPSILSDPVTADDLLLWHQKIEVYHAEYQSLVEGLQTALPEAQITGLDLASTLSATLDTTALAETAPETLFTADAPEGTELLLDLVGVVVQTAFSETPVLLEDVEAALPETVAASFTEISEAAFVAVGNTLIPRPSEPDAPTDPDTPAEPADDVTGPAPLTVFTGTDGDDLIDLDAALRFIDGGAGVDTLTVGGTSVENSVTITSSGSVLLKPASGDSAVVLNDVERIAFEDGTLAFDDEGLAGQAYRLYQACFDRTPDVEGLGFWIKLLDDGAIDLNQAANFFLASEEFADVYGPPNDLSDIHYLALLYANVLDRPPDLDGFSFWRSAQESGITRADMLVFFSESAENVAQVAPAIDDGIWYI